MRDAGTLNSTPVRLSASISKQRQQFVVYATTDELAAHDAYMQRIIGIGA